MSFYCEFIVCSNIGQSWLTEYEETAVQEVIIVFICKLFSFLMDVIFIL